MKIITDTRERDYYDSAIGYDSDSSLIYVRKQERKIIARSLMNYNNDYDDGSINISFKVIGFCGTLYPIIIIQGYNWNNEKGKNYFYNNFYSFADFENSKHFRFAKNNWSIRRLREEFEHWSRQEDDIFVQLDAPIFLLESYNSVSEAITNINLKHFDFFKIKDAFTAYQDIATYLGCQLAKENQPLEIEDKYKISQHGFDKESFRNPIKVSKLKG